MPAEAQKSTGDKRTKEQREFFLKWFNRLAEAFTGSGRGTPGEAGGPDGGRERGRLSALKVKALLNLFNTPFYCAGIIFVAWLVMDQILRSYLSQPVYAGIVRISRPIEGIAGPAVVGYWTNYLAIKMLFRPRRSNAVWWGLIPARRAEFVEIMAGGINDHLFSGRIVRQYLLQSGLLQGLASRLAGAASEVTRDPLFRHEFHALLRTLATSVVNRRETRETVRRAVMDNIHNRLDAGLATLPLLWTRRAWLPLAEDVVMSALDEAPKGLADLKPLIDRWLDDLPRRIEKESESIGEAATELAERGLQALDVQAIIRTQLDKMDEARLEELLLGNVDTEMTFIQVCGGFFGLAAALALNYPVMRLVFLAAGVVLWSVYQLTVEGSRARTWFRKKFGK